VGPHPETWLQVLPDGLYCEPGGFYIDPVRPVNRAIITHAHSDHARPGHGAVLASPETMALMDVRMGVGRSGVTQQVLEYGETVNIGGVSVWIEPAGHVLGSAQVAMEWRGSRAVVSGDYKRSPDPTCRPFVPIACDVFVTEATFALPVFRHPPAIDEIGRLLASVALYPERTHVIGAYALGKAQRVIALLRQAGWDAPIYLHGAQIPLCTAYERLGVPLGPRLADPVVCGASGWMRVRQRARSKGVELPLVISDHCDWDELLATLDEVAAPEVWVTHGREDALIHAAGLRGIRGRALRLMGYGEDDEDVPVAE